RREEGKRRPRGEAVGQTPKPPKRDTAGTPLSTVPAQPLIIFGPSMGLGPMFLPWRGETRLYLNLKEWDGSSAATPLGPEAAALSRFDSLGENCELALAQRHYGVELPLSLLRWAGTTYENVARGLECRFEGLGDPATTTAEWIDIDYRIQTPYLRLHTSVIEPRDEEGVAEVRHHGCATLRLLRRKLLRDIADARRIFVFKTADPGFGPAEMRRLHAAMRAIRPASLLCVTRKDRAEACRVEKLADGLYAGRLERFVHPHGPFDEWVALCSETRIGRAERQPGKQHRTCATAEGGIALGLRPLRRQFPTCCAGFASSPPPRCRGTCHSPRFRISTACASYKRLRCWKSNSRLRSRSSRWSGFSGFATSLPSFQMRCRRNEQCRARP